MSCYSSSHNRADRNDCDELAREFTVRFDCAAQVRLPDIALRDVNGAGAIALNRGDVNLETTFRLVGSKTCSGRAPLTVCRDIEIASRTEERPAGPALRQREGQFCARYRLIIFVSYFDDWIAARSTLDIVNGAVAFDHHDPQALARLRTGNALEHHQPRKQHCHKPHGLREIHINVLSKRSSRYVHAMIHIVALKPSIV